MHPDEIATDADLVRRLLVAQFPEWADLPVVRIESAGTDNALYRIGDELIARLPRIGWAVGAGEKDRWLPRLAPYLPLEIPVPVAQGEPGEGYPHEWLIHRWVDGEIATPDRLDDLSSAAREFAAFITALHAIDPTDAPAGFRGGPLPKRDEAVREAIDALRGELDEGAATAVWNEALGASPWDRPSVWVHGDLYDGNLLARDGRLCAVIDWGGAGVGDPACDLIVAWSLFSGESRDVFRADLDVDDATWARGRGWALSVALIAIPYYRETNPVIVANSWHRIAELVAERLG